MQQYYSTCQSYHDANLDSEGLGKIQVSRQLEDFKSQSAYSICGDVLPTQPLSSRASDKGNDGGNILRSAQTIVWVLLRNEINNLGRLAFSEEGSVDRSRWNGVNGDTTTAEILGKDPRNLLNRTLGSNVTQRIREDS